MAHVWTTLKACICFGSKEIIPSAITSSGNIFGMKLESAEALFISPSSELLSAGY